MRKLTKERNLTMDNFAALVNCAIKKIADSKVYTRAMRDEIKTYQFEMDEESTEFTEIKAMYESLSKNGDAEKFYSKYYGSVALHATQCFKNLSRNSATLLSTKIADQLLANSKKLQSPNPCDSLKKMSEKEKTGLQYLGGYVLQLAIVDIHRFVPRVASIYLFLCFYGTSRNQTRSTSTSPNQTHCHLAS